MANSYTQVHVHFVIAVQNRRCLISDSWEEELYKYITGILQNAGQKVLQINGMPDHVHIFIGMRSSHSISDIMKMVKSESSKWINEKGFTKAKFSWQQGYGAFSYSKSHVPAVIRYIQNQKAHHRVKRFQDENMELLQKFGVEYDERYIFKPIT